VEQIHKGQQGGCGEELEATTRRNGSRWRPWAENGGRSSSGRGRGGRHREGTDTVMFIVFFFVENFVLFIRV
jgi:hypothetical protein